MTAAKRWARFWRCVWVAAILVLVGVEWRAYEVQQEKQRALMIMLRTGNALVFDLGPEFNRRQLPRDLLDRMLDRAIEGYNQALLFNPRSVEAYRSRGTAYFFKRDYDQRRPSRMHAETYGRGLHGNLQRKNVKEVKEVTGTPE